MRSKIFNRLLKIKFLGQNWNYFENYLLSQGVTLYDIEKNSYNNITFYVNKSDYNKITKIKKSHNYNLEIVDDKNSGLNSTKLLSRIGVVFGLLLSILGSLTFSKLTLHYNIYGLNTIDKSIVESVLYDYGIRLGKVNSFENSDLENYLMQNIDGLSLVSVMRKGTTICINFKEKDDFLSKIQTNLVSPYNFVISSIDVVSGTCLYDVGDVVVAGSTLVSSQDVVNGGGVSGARGSIKGEAWWVGSVTFEKQKEVLVPTGRKKTLRQLMFGDRIYKSTNYDSSFEVQKITYSVSDYLSNFLPIRFVTTTYYECEKQVIVQNLEENKQILLQESRLLAYNKVPTNIIVSGEEQKIVDMGDYYLVSTYLTAPVEVKSAN